VKIGKASSYGGSTALLSLLSLKKQALQTRRVRFSVLSKGRAPELEQK